MNILYEPPRLLKKCRDGTYRNSLGQLHRLHGPALLRGEDGVEEEYYVHGKRHRSDGPARIWSDGSFEHYLDGRLAGGAPTARRSKAVAGEEPLEEWRNREGQLHRSDGPALLLPTGEQIYYKEGKIHRLGGPAIIRDKEQAARTGHPSEVWMREGLKDRSNGPAVLYPQGACSYWQRGVLHRSYGPAVVGMDRVAGGYRIAWIRNSQPDREGGPAIVDAEGRQFYYQKGLLHRIDGPAIVDPLGIDDGYYLFGVFLEKDDWEKKAAALKKR